MAPRCSPRCPLHQCHFRLPLAITLSAGAFLLPRFLMQCSCWPSTRRCRMSCMYGPSACSLLEHCATAGAGRFQFPWTTTLHLFTPVLSLMLLLLLLLLLRDLDHPSCLPLSVQHSPLLGALVHVQPPLASPAAALHRVQQQQHQFVTSQGTLSTLDTSFAPPS
jgi:hypothetical protein